ncbi:MAG: hypothetical protein ONB48_12900 [candidate division KSB1 bacterium]|nr:hypothetical protein [candidate division KSB1 bacterium]MDZ7286545.1 hypothetical protein [candidate division KSB1 bacterium]MDZ7299291.1 hypothetical protein [candidate division KSB1 bacterium]MDZ7307369.1 hypothetical protein [candidate division KSB1 bacterium]MDZ7350155.1 hypothetical protein [candidate division KSB1 bacterium]
MPAPAHGRDNRRGFHPVVLLVLLFASAAPAAAPAGPEACADHKQRSASLTVPSFLQTNTLWHAPAGLHLSFADELRRDWHAPLSGLRGRLLRLGVIRLDAGVAESVVLQVRGAVWQQLTIDERASQPRPGFPRRGTIRDAGDFSVATVVRLVQNAGHTTALGLRVATRLPNSTQKKGIGTNTTDVFLAVLFAQRFHHITLLTETGLGILTAPLETDEQNDVLIYGLAASCNISPRLQIAAEINGYLTTRNLIPAGTEARGVLRAGGRWRSRYGELEFSLAHGLTANEGGWGGLVGVGREVRF